MIRTVNLSKVYRQGVHALNDVSIDIAKGEFVFLVGPSGSGKSKFIRLLIREDVPSGGELFVAGKNIGQLAEWKVPMLRRNIGCVFQDFKLLSKKTVFENVAFALEVIGSSRANIKKQATEVLELVGLEGKFERMPEELSGGEQQRVSIARAFVNHPQILLADEPTGNLDPSITVEIMKLLDQINKTGTTVVMATHDHAIVDAMRRRVIELEAGIVIRDQERGVYGYGARI